MSTPAVLFASMVKLMILCLTTFWVTSFTVSRFVVFYEAYSNALRVVRDEEWVRGQCSDPLFYSNLKQHSDLCLTVQINFERSPFLVGLNAVADTAYLCGRRSCADVLADIANGGWPVILTCGLFSLLAPTAVVHVFKHLVAGERRLAGDLPHHHHYNKLL